MESHAIDESSKRRPAPGRPIRWAYVMNWSQRVLSASVSLALSVYVGPEGFGTIAMALVVLSAAQMFVDQGITAALIQSNELTETRLGSALLVVLTVTLILSLAVVVAAPLWAEYNNTPQLTGVLWLLSPGLLLDGVAVIPRALLQRRMEFKALSLRTALSIVGGGLIGVASASVGLGLWAIVCQNLTERLVGVSVAWSLCGWRPQWKWSLSDVRQVVSVSLRILVLKITTFLHLEADILIVGHMCGPVTAGVYRLAQRLTSMAVDAFTGSLQVVSLSEFSLLKARPGEIPVVMRRFLRISCSVTIPSLAVLAVVGPSIVRILGPKWAGSAVPLRLLAAAGATHAIIAFAGPLMTALGRPGEMAMASGLLACINMCTLLIASSKLAGESGGQAGGIAFARLTVNYLVMLPLFTMLIVRGSGIGLADVWAAVKPGMITAAGAAAGATAAQAIPSAGEMSPIGTVVTQLGLAGVLALPLAWRYDSEARARISTMIFRGRD